MHLRPLGHATAGYLTGCGTDASHPVVAEELAEQLARLVGKHADVVELAVHCSLDPKSYREAVAIYGQSAGERLGREYGDRVDRGRLS